MLTKYARDLFPEEGDWTVEAKFNTRSLVPLGLCLFLASIGCMGGSHVNGYLLYPPSRPAQDVVEAAEREITSHAPTGFMTPIGVRVYGDAMVVIDVLVVLPPQNVTKGWTGESEAAFRAEFAMNGVGTSDYSPRLLIEKPDGQEVRIARVVQPQPPSADQSRRYSLNARMSDRTRTERFVHDGHEYWASMISMMYEADRALQPGEIVLVRFSGGKTTTVFDASFDFAPRSIVVEEVVAGSR